MLSILDKILPMCYNYNREVVKVTWGAYQQHGLDEEIDSLGSRLSIEIGCPVHYPAYNKNLFECKCGVIFPLYVVKAQNWLVIRKKHTDERMLVN